MELSDLYWEEYDDFVSENKVDKRWILKSNKDDKSYGSLRVVSHPDLRPGYLRSIYTVVTSISKRTKADIMKTISDYQMDVVELEVYNIKDDIKTETTQFEAPYRQLEELFKVKIF